MVVQGYLQDSLFLLNFIFMKGGIVLTHELVIKDCNLQKIADSGQCFRMRRLDSGVFVIPSAGHLARGIQDGINAIISFEGEEGYWKEYFDYDTDYEQLRQTFKSLTRGFDFIQKAVDFSEGLRLLRQDPFETFISFIISQRKNIKAISSCIEELSRLWGTEIENEFYAFPTVDQFYENIWQDVTSLGYRNEYVRQAVIRIHSGYSLNVLKTMGYDCAKTELCSFYGVGNKVADCTLLYGLGYTDAFPVDVWIKRILEDDLQGRFNPDAIPTRRGILQLMMFYYKRWV